MRPDEVLEDLADVRRLVDRAEDRVDGAGADVLPPLDELDELLDDRLRLRDLRVVAAQREPVSAQIDGAAEPFSQGVEYPVADACELGGDIVRNVENRLHKPSVGLRDATGGLVTGVAKLASAGSSASVSDFGSYFGPLFSCVATVSSSLVPSPSPPLVATSARAHTTPQIRAQEAHARAVKAEVNRIGIQLTAIEGRAQNAQYQLQQAKASLASNTQKLRRARANFHAAQQRLMQRLYSLYVSGEPTTLDVLAGAKSLSQVIDRAEAAQTMSQQDTTARPGGAPLRARRPEAAARTDAASG